MITNKKQVRVVRCINCRWEIRTKGALPEKCPKCGNSRFTVTEEMEKEVITK